MPVHVREWLEKALIDRGFSEYKDLEALLKEKGFNISHAAIHRHGQRLERRLSAIKASTEAARLIAESAPDNEDHRSAAVMSMIQTSLFDALMDLQDAESLPPDERIPILAKASQGFAKLAASSLLQKKWASEVEEKLRGLEDAARNGSGKKKLDEETLKAVREAIYGR